MDKNLMEPSAEEIDPQAPDAYDQSKRSPLVTALGF